MEAGAELISQMRCVRKKVHQQQADGLLPWATEDPRSVSQAVQAWRTAVANKDEWDTLTPKAKRQSVMDGTGTDPMDAVAVQGGLVDL
eukprot:8759223-Karenia_brevis.AAC.1